MKNLYPIATAAPRRSFAARTVFAISIAMVSGPTPPGTGVMAPATSATSGCTSPTSVDPFFAKACFALFVACEEPVEFGAVGDFVHADIDDGGARLTKSRVIMPARPMAATRMSARRQTAGRSRRLRVADGDGGVARSAAASPSACRRCRCARRPRPVLPATSMRMRRSISITPAGVHGTRPGRWVER